LRGRQYGSARWVSGGIAAKDLRQQILLPLLYHKAEQNPIPLKFFPVFVFFYFLFYSVSAQW